MLTEKISVSYTCCVCLNERSDVITRKKYYQKIHTYCDYPSKDTEMDILCSLCFKTENAIEEKINSKLNLEIQAKKMKMDLKKKFLLLFWELLYKFLFLMLTRGEVISSIY